MQEKDIVTLENLLIYVYTLFIYTKRKEVKNMALYFPSFLLTTTEAEEIGKNKLLFDNKGYLIDDNLKIQKHFENYFEQAVLSIQKTTQNNIIILTDEYSVVQINPITKNRLAILKGDSDYIKSLLELMIQFHPTVKPETIISSYSFGCSPNDKFILRNWCKETYHCV